MARQIYRNPTEVPQGVKVLGLAVQVPRFLFATDKGVHDELTINETIMVYAEITQEEFERVKGDQVAINALGQELGPEIANALGGYVKGWH